MNRELCIERVGGEHNWQDRVLPSRLASEYRFCSLCGESQIALKDGRGGKDYVTILEGLQPLLNAA